MAEWDSRFGVVFPNACIQWVPEHERIPYRTTAR